MRPWEFCESEPAEMKNPAEDINQKLRGTTAVSSSVFSGAGVVKTPLTQLNSCSNICFLCFSACMFQTHTCCTWLWPIPCCFMCSYDFLGTLIKGSCLRFWRARHRWFGSQKMLQHMTAWYRDKFYDSRQQSLLKSATTGTTEGNGAVVRGYHTHCFFCIEFSVCHRHGCLSSCFSSPCNPGNACMFTIYVLITSPNLIQKLRRHSEGTFRCIYFVSSREELRSLEICGNGWFGSNMDVTFHFF